MAKKTTLIFIILVLGLGLRLINLNQSFWLDEASQALMSSQSVHSIWFHRGGDFHPPLFYILAHYWLSFSRSEIWLRLLPVTFGVLTIYVIYILADTKIKVYAALFLAINPFLIYYSQEFRSYSLLCLLASLSMLFSYRRNFFLLAIINLLLLYTHYASVFFLFSEVLYFVFYDRKHLTNFIVWNLLIGILYIPWLPQFIQQLYAGTNIDSSFPGWRDVLSLSPLKALPLTLFKLIAGRITFISRPLYTVYVFFVLSTTLISLFVARSAKDLFTWTFVPLFSILLVSFWLPQNQPFRVLYVVIPLTLLVARSAVRFPKLILTLFIYIALTGNIIYYTRPRLQREQWRQTVQFLNQQSGAVVVKFPGPFDPLQWYGLKLPVIAAVPSFPSNDLQVSRSLMNLSSKYSQVYLLQYLTDLTDPNLLVEKNLRNQGFVEVQTRTSDFPGVGFVYLYEKNRL